MSVYFAVFPSEYLEIIRNIDIDMVKHRERKITLNHTRRYNLFNTVDRTEFIKEFIALLRFVASGEANIGHLCKDSPVIHRNMNEGGDVKVASVFQPPQEAMDEAEQDKWKELYAWQYVL